VTEESPLERGPDLGFVRIDIDVAQSARVYDFLQGGVDNFEIDRIAAEQMASQSTGIEGARRRVRAKRRFLGRAVRYLAGEAGVRQFLDIGSGVPSDGNVLSVAQATAPECRVVSVDNDHVVLAHAHTLRGGTPEGAADFILGDLRDSDDILSRAAATLDFSEPIAVVFVGVLHHFPDEEDPWGLVRRYVDALPSGSYLVLEHIGSESEDIAKLGEVTEALQLTGFDFVLRSRDAVARFFEGLELVEPGLGPIDNWRRDGECENPNPGGVARKP
jgi:S-adenosyl methyltransferase